MRRGPQKFLKDLKGLGEEPSKFSKGFEGVPLILPVAAFSNCFLFVLCRISKLFPFCSLPKFQIVPLLIFPRFHFVPRGWGERCEIIKIFVQLNFNYKGFEEIDHQSNVFLFNLSINSFFVPLFDFPTPANFSLFPFDLFDKF